MDKSTWRLLTGRHVKVYPVRVPVKRQVQFAMKKYDDLACNLMY